MLFVSTYINKLKYVNQLTFYNVMKINQKGGFFMKLLRRISAIVLIICVLFNIVATSNNVIVAKADSKIVELYYFDGYGGKYGMSKYTVYVKVNSKAQHKEVFLHYYNPNGSKWEEQEGSYVTTLPDGTEIWKVTPAITYDVLYAIKFVGDGQVYWDNNNGNNFTLKDVLGCANMKLRRINTYSSLNKTTINVTAVVKNIAFQKVVGVRYTDDDWASYQNVELKYSAPIEGTNSEIWTGTIEIDSSEKSSFHFCGYYTVNGVTYWDNNFGANYNIDYTYQY